MRSFARPRTEAEGSSPRKDPRDNLFRKLLGLAFTAYVPNIEMYSWYYTMFFTPLFLFSGIFFPLEERFPPWALAAAQATPLYHAARLMRSASAARLGLADVASLGYLAVGTVVLVLVAVRRLRRRLMT